MEPPSPNLIATLNELRLAGPRELRRATRSCRLLAEDLPAFDSVWIDALIQSGVLTHFQAERLRNGASDQLRIGPYLIVDRLGDRQRSHTFLARLRAGGPPAVLKQICVTPERRQAVLDRLRDLVVAADKITSPNVVPPCEILDADEGIFMRSRFVSGDDARVSLIRQGRLPVEAVTEIARQLLAALAETQRFGIAHGDVRLCNIRLTDRGVAVLVNPGLRSALSPVISPHDPQPPERYDGVAPERIGTAAPATAATDVYALGCLLWQLLAGRPPFPMGDPLARLAAHGSQPVPDVRDFAPDASKELILAIGEMTKFDPESRPTDLQALRLQLRPSSRSLRRSSWNISQTTGRGVFPWSLAAAALFALTGASAFLADRDAVSSLLATRTFATKPTDVAEQRSPQRVRFKPMPPADSRGVVTFRDAGPYEASDVRFRGPLTLRAQPDRPARIIVIDEPLHLWGDEVTIENVAVAHAPSTGATTVPALVLVESQNLTVRSCRIEGHSPAGDASMTPQATPSAGIAWRMIDRADPTAGRVHVTDTVARHLRSAVLAVGPIRRIMARNALAINTKSLISLPSPGRSTVNIDLANVTLRDADSVIDLAFEKGSPSVHVSAEDSILDLAAGSAIFAVSPDVQIADLRWSGEGVITTRDVRPLISSPSRSRAAIPSDVGEKQSVEGLQHAEVQFAGPAAGSDAASVASVRGVPRRSDRPAGIDLSKLPPTLDVLAGAR